MNFLFYVHYCLPFYAIQAKDAKIKDGKRRLIIAIFTMKEGFIFPAVNRYHIDIIKRAFFNRKNQRCLVATIESGFLVWMVITHSW